MLPAPATLGEPSANLGLFSPQGNTQAVGEGRKSVVYQNQAALGLIKSYEKPPAAFSRLGIGQGREIPSGLLAVSLGFCFSLSVRLVMRSPLGPTPALLQGVCLLQFCLFCPLVALLNPWVS